MKKRISALLSALLALTLLMNPVALAEEGIIVIDGGTGSQSLGCTELEPENRVKMDGYAIEFVSAISFSDEWFCANHQLIYVTSKEDGAEIMTYRFPAGTHVPTRIWFQFTNLTTEKVNLLDRVDCWIEYDGQYRLDGFLPLQLNPDQVAAGGYTGIPSTKGVPIESLLSVDFLFMADLPKVVQDSSKPLLLYLTIDDADTFVVDLREVIEFQA